jgi:hypothetical protein
VKLGPDKHVNVYLPYYHLLGPEGEGEDSGHVPGGGIYR